MTEVTVHSPASVSNVVCGFDCLGFALAEPYDVVTVRRTDDAGIRITDHSSYSLPTDPARNVAGVAVQAMIDADRLSGGFEIEITKGIKPGSGIGSSSASSCGAVAAVNELLGRRHSKQELVEFAMAGEVIASGTRHADNVAPCIFGGFTLVRSIDPVDIVALEFASLWTTVIHPQIEIKTSDARALLPENVSLADAVHGWSNLGAFVAALQKGDFDLLARSMQDAIVEPARKGLIPKFDEVKAASMAAGAIGGGISGSGPSTFMLSASEERAREVAEAMRAVYSATGIDFNVYVSPIEPAGVRFV